MPASAAIKCSMVPTEMSGLSTLVMLVASREIMHQVEAGRDGNPGVQSVKHHAMVGRRRTQGEANSLSAVEAHADA